MYVFILIYKIYIYVPVLRNKSVPPFKCIVLKYFVATTK